jgi:hypothetical protein
MSDGSTAAVEHLDVAAEELRAAAGGLLWHVKSVAEATRTAVRSASEYHSAAGHIAVEADLNAAPDDA